MYWSLTSPCAAAPTAQWLKDEKPIKPSKYFKMEQEGDAFILRISECFPEDEGTYFCVATNSAGKSTMKAPLKVQGKWILVS